jgi:DNA/RNA endonuclease G (NUC1)
MILFNLVWRHQVPIYKTTWRHVPEVHNFDIHCYKNLRSHIIYTWISDSYRKESDGKTYIRYQVIGANSVAVPTHFFKVIVGETADQKLEMEAYVMPNQVIDDSTPLTVFQVSCKEVMIAKT